MLKALAWVRSRHGGNLYVKAQKTMMSFGDYIAVPKILFLMNKLQLSDSKVNRSPIKTGCG